MAENNRFDRFSGDEIIFIYIAMDTYAQGRYTLLLKENQGKLSDEEKKKMEMIKHLISEIVEFGREQGSIPKKT